MTIVFLGWWIGTFACMCMLYGRPLWNNSEIYNSLLDDIDNFEYKGGRCEFWFNPLTDFSDDRKIMGISKVLLGPIYLVKYNIFNLETGKRYPVFLGSPIHKLISEIVSRAPNA